MATVQITCAWCSRRSMKERGAVNRSRKAGLYLYCDRTCSGLGRRRPEEVTPAELKALKADYDREYRAKNRERLRAEKAARHLLTYDPEKARVERKAKMHRHVEYCRQPAYRTKKRTYDKQYRAQKQFGPFAEASLLLSDLEAEINTRATRYEIYQQNGTLNKRQQRKRDHARHQH